MNRQDKATIATIAAIFCVFLLLIFVDVDIRLGRATSTDTQLQINAVHAELDDLSDGVAKRVAERNQQIATFERQVTENRFTAKQGEALAEAVGPKAVEAIHAAATNP